ncbi:MAG TPA: DUF4160 domain-containing protein [Beijerinckiaceae bacterium]|nr:DUF4160 domain-containing protein [Beijerinckiaceae bacterium]
MVVIHRAFGFRFVIYTSDHEPAHVHITGPGQAKIKAGGSRWKTGSDLQHRYEAGGHAPPAHRDCGTSQRIHRGMETDSWPARLIRTSRLLKRAARRCSRRNPALERLAMMSRRGAWNSS